MESREIVPQNQREFFIFCPELAAVRRGRIGYPTIRKIR